MNEIRFRLTTLRNRLLSIGTGPIERELREEKRNQTRSFELLNSSFSTEYFEALKGQEDVAEFITGEWKRLNTRVALDLLPIPSINFLRIPPIAYTMFAMPRRDVLDQKLAIIESVWGKEGNQLLQEDPVGRPYLLRSHHKSSSNLAHHLFHVTKFKLDTGVDPSSLRHVVEWGGGYGSFARLVRRLAPASTYTLIDTPLFACLQWLYLSAVLGESEVRLVKQGRPTIEEGLVNIISLPLLPLLSPAPADIFISLWALSESTTKAQDYVAAQKWFGASMLMLGFQEEFAGQTTSTRVGELAKHQGAAISPVLGHPGNHYAFRA